MDYREKVALAWSDAAGDKLSLSFEEFMAVKQPEPQDGDKWGNWTFRRKFLTLEFRNEENVSYEINLEQMDTILDVIVWQKHLSEKTFITAEDLGNFFFAIQDLCKAWYRTDTNVSDLIRKRFPACRVN